MVEFSMTEEVSDILEEILVRLDVIDLIRCKNVCKLWRSFISNPGFAKAHINHSYNNDRRRNTYKSGPSMRIILCGSEPRCNYISYLNLYSTRSSNVCNLLGSSNGLVCLSPSHSRLIVANPSTREVRSLQHPGIPESFRKAVCWGFGYDSSTDDYKVILGYKWKPSSTAFNVLTLKSNVWRYLGEVEYCILSQIGTLCNGAIHWLMDDYRMTKGVILSLDLSTEEFIEIPQPDDARYEFSACCSLGITEECLSIFCPNRRPYLTCKHIWVMKTYNVKQSWGFFPYVRERDFGVIRHLKTNQDYVPHVSFFDTNCRLDPINWVNLASPIFVQSLVSPHICKRLKRKRKPENNDKLIKGDPSAA